MKEQLRRLAIWGMVLAFVHQLRHEQSRRQRYLAQARREFLQARRRLMLAESRTRRGWNSLVFGVRPAHHSLFPVGGTRFMGRNRRGWLVTRRNRAWPFATALGAILLTSLVVMLTIQLTRQRRNAGAGRNGGEASGPFGTGLTADEPGSPAGWGAAPTGRDYDPTGLGATGGVPATQAAIPREDWALFCSDFGSENRTWTCVVEEEDASGKQRTISRGTPLAGVIYAEPDGIRIMLGDQSGKNRQHTVASPSEIRPLGGDGGQKGMQIRSDDGTITSLRMQPPGAEQAR
jgi:hypothetical protein